MSPEERFDMFDRVARGELSAEEASWLMELDRWRRARWAGLAWSVVLTVAIVGALAMVEAR